MSKRKIKRKIEEIESLSEEKSDIKFCTECGDALEDFSVSEQADNPDAVIENFHNCKKTGKFKGDVCSKMYMISPPSEDID
ncbi:MAG: hypothetical protein N3F03_04405 [Ignavibacteria bacterium]|nr:hypothetical protein [Ignavibacteria bacterium]